MEIKGQNLNGQTYSNVSGDVFVACNIEACKFEGNLDVTFEKCNVKECDFTGAIYDNVVFVKSNIIKTEIDAEKVTLDKSNIITEEDEDKRPELA